MLVVPARPEGIEPPTRGLEVRRSIRLSYGRRLGPGLGVGSVATRPGPGDAPTGAGRQSRWTSTTCTKLEMTTTP